MSQLHDRNGKGLSLPLETRKRKQADVLTTLAELEGKEVTDPMLVDLARKFEDQTFKAVATEHEYHQRIATKLAKVREVRSQPAGVRQQPPAAPAPVASYQQQYAPAPGRGALPVSAAPAASGGYEQQQQYAMAAAGRGSFSSAPPAQAAAPGFQQQYPAPQVDYAGAPRGIQRTSHVQAQAGAAAVPLVQRGVTPPYQPPQRQQPQQQHLQQQPPPPPPQQQQQQQQPHQLQPRVPPAMPQAVAAMTDEQRKQRAELLRQHYEKDIQLFVRHGTNLLEKLSRARSSAETSNSTQVKKLFQYVREGHNALTYMERCHTQGHVPSAPSLQSLEHTLLKVTKASHAVQEMIGSHHSGRQGTASRDPRQRQQQQPASAAITAPPQEVATAAPIVRDTSAGFGGGGGSAGPALQHQHRLQQQQQQQRQHQQRQQEHRQLLLRQQQQEQQPLPHSLLPPQAPARPPSAVSASGPEEMVGEIDMDDLEPIPLPEDFGSGGYGGADDWLMLGGGPQEPTPSWSGVPDPSSDMASFDDNFRATAAAPAAAAAGLQQPQLAVRATSLTSAAALAALPAPVTPSLAAASSEIDFEDNLGPDFEPIPLDESWGVPPPPPQQQPQPMRRGTSEAAGVPPAQMPPQAFVQQQQQMALGLPPQPVRRGSSVSSNGAVGGATGTTQWPGLWTGGQQKQQLPQQMLAPSRSGSASPHAAAAAAAAAAHGAAVSYAAATAPPPSTLPTMPLGAPPSNDLAPPDHLTWTLAQLQEPRHAPRAQQAAAVFADVSRQQGYRGLAPPLPVPPPSDSAPWMSAGSSSGGDGSTVDMQLAAAVAAAAAEPNRESWAAAAQRRGAALAQDLRRNVGGLFEAVTTGLEQRGPGSQDPRNPQFLPAVTARLETAKETTESLLECCRQLDAATASSSVNGNGSGNGALKRCASQVGLDQANGGLGGNKRVRMTGADGGASVRPKEELQGGPAAGSPMHSPVPAAAQQLRMPTPSLRQGGGSSINGPGGAAADPEALVAALERQLGDSFELQGEFQSSGNGGGGRWLSRLRGVCRGSFQVYVQFSCKEPAGGVGGVVLRPLDVSLLAANEGPRAAAGGGDGQSLLASASGASPWPTSSHHVYQRVSGHAFQVLHKFFDKAGGDMLPALVAFFQWLASNRGLFRDPCQIAAKQVVLESGSAEPLPPFVRDLQGVPVSHAAAAGEPRSAVDAAPEGAGGGKSAAAAPVVEAI